MKPNISYYSKRYLTLSLKGVFAYRRFKMSKGGEFFSVAVVIGVSGYVVYRLLTKPKYQAGDVLTAGGLSSGYLTIIRIADGMYEFQDGIWPEVSGPVYGLPTKTVDNDPDYVYYTHVTISSIGDGYYDPDYFNRGTSSDDEGGTDYYDLVPVTVRGSNGNGNMGIPRTDVERAMNHYGITPDQYFANPPAYPLPPRGTGLSR